VALVLADNDPDATNYSFGSPAGYKTGLFWQDFQYVNGTFDLSEIECDIQEIRELLDVD